MLGGEGQLLKEDGGSSFFTPVFLLLYSLKILPSKSKGGDTGPSPVEGEGAATPSDRNWSRPLTGVPPQAPGSADK